MFKNLFAHGSRLLTRPQNTILSAALIIAVMIAVSRFLGLIRNRVLAQFFTADILSTYFAAFRLPEVVFEVFIFGALSSAFIPTFTTYLSKKKITEAWYVASVSLNFAFLIFSFFALLVLIFAGPLYRLITPGYSPDQVATIASLSRILIFAQAFFVLSYFLTGMLESMQRFLAPAIAPIFYNLGIIFGAIFFSARFGIYAPAFGAVLGACLHFLIQLPVAWHFGFRPRLVLDFFHPGVREIGRLALPRIFELSILQLGKIAELFLASLVSPAAYTYFTFANSLQLVPVSLFGSSIAKASLPALSFHSAQQDHAKFYQTFITSFNEIVFLVVPVSVFLITLRVPLVRLIFGAARFDWEATLQTGQVLTAFSLGIFAQAVIYLLSRAFYALHDTKTPVLISVATLLLNILLAGLFIGYFHLGIWSLALAYSLSVLCQTLILLVALKHHLPALNYRAIFVSLVKTTTASVLSASATYLILKLLDLTYFDTRYTINLILLLLVLTGFGFTSFFLLSRLLHIPEVAVFGRLLSRFHLANLRKRELSHEPLTLSTPVD